MQQNSNNISLTTAASIAGREWHHLGDIQRKEYEQECDGEWKEFRTNIVQYKENDGFTKWRKEKQRLPKRMYPKSPVAIYIRHHFKEYKEKAVLGNQSIDQLIFMVFFT